MHGQVLMIDQQQTLPALLYGLMMAPLKRVEKG